ncbi:MAG: phosphatidylserine decarboxylase family protein [Ignavibacteriales bacterium]|nr:phosphatidylserine decarboxylase family protein [Ignavibacteriales bacterium]
MLAKYGYNTIGIISIIVAFLFVLFLFINSGFIRWSIFFISSLIFLFTLYFFRDPERNISKKSNIIVSPADGKIIKIEEIDSNSYIKEKSHKISIFMSPLNVHVNRIPIDGKIDFLNYIPGEYLVAFHEKSDERNERNEIGIMSTYGKVYFCQIAGFIARRIECELELCQEVKMGERFGMIKFGSRVDVVVPIDWKIKVKNEQHVKAGETILFEHQ